MNGRTFVRPSMGFVLMREVCIVGATLCGRPSVGLYKFWFSGDHERRAPTGCYGSCVGAGLCSARFHKFIYIFINNNAANERVMPKIHFGVIFSLKNTDAITADNIMDKL